MDRAEAARLLRREMSEQAGRPHAELAKLISDSLVYEVEGPDGVRFQIEVEAYWLERPGGPLHVLATIDDGTLRGAFRPVTDGFVHDPDGTVRMTRADVG